MRRVDPLPRLLHRLPDALEGAFRGAVVQEEPPRGLGEGLGLPPEAMAPGELLLVEEDPGPQALKEAGEAVVVGVVVGEEDSLHVLEAEAELRQMELQGPPGGPGAEGGVHEGHLPRPLEEVEVDRLQGVGDGDGKEVKAGQEGLHRSTPMRRRAARKGSGSSRCQGKR